MTAVAPQGPVPASQTPSDPSPSLQTLSWEGDKMFNIYIYDYCFKRGFRKTARELLLEAEIPSDSAPPINARQGLLFEWWSVFWVLFTAKANGSGTDDAMMYTQHQAAQAAMKTRPQTMPMQGTVIGRPPVNGVGPRPFPPNGVMANGIPPGNGQPSAPTPFGAPMPNGIMPGPPPGMGQPQFARQPRPPNGGPPFQSPTMAHSPPNSGQQPQPPSGQSHPQPPMGQLGPPHRGPMLPPGPGQGMNPGQQNPAPYPSNLPRPPSRASTPMMNRSPSMVARQPPILSGDMRQQENHLNNELQSIAPHIINMYKSEIGVPGNKEIAMLTIAEKSRIIMTHRARSQRPGPPGPNAAAGPSMQAPPRRNNKRNSTSPGEDPTQPDDGLAPNGTSPPDRKRVRRSPMEGAMAAAPISGYPQPPNQNTQPQPGGLSGPPGGPGPGGPQPPMGSGGMMRGPMSGGFPPQGQPNMQMSGPMGMLGGMNPMMPGAMPSTMSPQMHPAQQAMYRQGMHNLPPQQRMPGAMNAGSPGADPSFNPGVSMPPGPPGGPGPQSQQPMQAQQPPPGGQFAPGSRLSGPPNPKAMSMLPPPSPAKDQNAANKDTNKPGTERSPRNQALTGPTPPTTAPPTPGATQGGQGGAPQGGVAPSPGLMINPNTSMNPAAMPLPPPPTPDNLFSSEFMQSMTGGLEDFDVGLFREQDINFERDFGQWFNNPDDVGSMDLGKQ